MCKAVSWPRCSTTRWALRWRPRLAAGEIAPTLNLNVSFERPAKVGTLSGKGRVLKRGRDVCFLAGELYQDGQRIASATATALVRKITDMNQPDPFPLDGGCDCRHVRYRMTTRAAVRALLPLPLVPARDAAPSFALNAMIEMDRIELLLARPPSMVDTPSEQRPGPEDRALPALPRRGVEPLRRRGRRRCAFVRVGTLDEPDRLPPDIHIFTASKQPWVVIPQGHAGGARVLRRQAALARREPGAPQGACAPGSTRSARLAGD